MEYRKLPHGDEQISILGMGTSVIGESGNEEEMLATFNMALDSGINYIDLASGYGASFAPLGKALQGRRDQVYLQIHFGASYESGQYGWTTDLKKIKEQIAWQLEQLQTDYIDFGFLHCLDEEADLKAVQENGVLDYILSLKEQGVVRHIGLSTHNPKLAHKGLDLGILDVIMFSINPAYDYQQGDYAIGKQDERMVLYRRCEKEGVAISVMKPFSGGSLLDERKSPFQQKLSRIQCLQYALDKPAVITVLPGIRNREELQDLLRYFEASEAEKDYSVLASFPNIEHDASCVYCRHCHPCPAGLDIAMINKFYDLTKLGDEMAREHYKNLEKHASDCVKCGHCNSRCPFHTLPMERMDTIAEYFGE